MLIVRMYVTTSNIYVIRETGPSSVGRSSRTPHPSPSPKGPHHPLAAAVLRQRGECACKRVNVVLWRLLWPQDHPPTHRLSGVMA